MGKRQRRRDRDVGDAKKPHQSREDFLDSTRPTSAADELKLEAGECLAEVIGDMK